VTVCRSMSEERQKGRGRVSWLLCQYAIKAKIHNGVFWKEVCRLRRLADSWTPQSDIDSAPKHYQTRCRPTEHF
jgi:hypothetical protein